MSNQVAIRARLSEAIHEYNTKKEALESEVAAFEKAGERLKSSATVLGTWGRENIDTGHVYISTLEKSLLSSAWLALYEQLSLKTLMSANDKKQFEQGLSHAADFTLDNIKATFGDYILDPMGNILRGLAEVFCNLDQSYKSHDKVKIGVEGLPKRVILGGFGGWSGYGMERVTDIINALAAYQGKSMVGYAEVRQLEKDGDALKAERGIWLSIFKNGNGHLFFDKSTLKDINRALSQYYGEVLADCADDKPEKRAESTAVSKDLQYYPTPADVVDRVLNDLWIEKGAKILEPSCGCGRFLDGIKAKFKGTKLWGIEVDHGRAEQARAKGHNVFTGNFLETIPDPSYDFVIMNPPFYGTHYAKHVRHAMKFLKPGGILKAVLPITAETDHGLLDGLGEWRDLPVGSFRESGTNINTTVLTIRNRD